MSINKNEIKRIKEIVKKNPGCWIDTTQYGNNELCLYPKLSDYFLNELSEFEQDDWLYDNCLYEAISEECCINLIVALSELSGLKYNIL